MPRKRFKTEEIIQKLREAEVLLSQGKDVASACSAPKITSLRCRKVKSSDGDERLWSRQNAVFYGVFSSAEYFDPTAARHAAKPAFETEDCRCSKASLRSIRCVRQQDAVFSRPENSPVQIQSHVRLFALSDRARNSLPNMQIDNLDSERMPFTSRIRSRE
jgi:hypothetical protein